MKYRWSLVSKIGICSLLLATVFGGVCQAQLGMTNPVTVPDEPCYVQISDPNSTKGQLLLPDVYQLPEAQFLVNPSVNEKAYFVPDVNGYRQTNSLHPYLRYYARVAAGTELSSVPSVPPSQVLVDAVKLYAGRLPIGKSASGAQLDAKTWALKLAQLAVTGRRAYEYFRSWHPGANQFSGPQDADLINLVQKTDPTINPADLQDAVSHVLEASYSALWAIRANDPAWRAKRAQLGWIAVSGEDDTPHRPVNVYTAPYPQYDLPVAVSGPPYGTITAVTRYVVASSNTFLGPDTPPFHLPGPATVPQTLGPITAVGSGTKPILSGSGEIVAPPRQLPIDGVPVIPPENKIIIYIHGGGSRAEEAVPLANWLTVFGQEANPNQHYTIISFDLPSSAYGEPLDPARVYGNKYHPTMFHILDFEKQYVLGFIDALDQQLGNVKSRIVAIMGGSLGGNLSLMLGGLYTGGNPYLKTIVAWSPTSMIPTSSIGQQITAAVNLNKTNFGSEDGPGTRVDYFNSLYFQPTGNINGIDLLGLPPDPEMWYRRDWNGFGTTNGAANGTVTANLNCGKSSINQSRFDRYEIYSPAIRRWTTAIDTEQAMYSFHGADANSSTPRFQSISARLLLAAGENDNYSKAHVNAGLILAAATAGAAFTETPVGALAGAALAAAAATLNNVDIYGYTHDTANRMLGTPGRTLFIKNTGHSIHDERPIFFAQEIVNFLTTPDTTLQVNLSSGDAGLRWNSQAHAFFDLKNGGHYSIALNQWFHPWHSMPPALDNPCFLQTGLPCRELNYFEFHPRSSHAFAIGLSRTGFSVYDITAFGIQFISGQRVATDTGDNWDLKSVTLAALGGIQSYEDRAGKPLKTLHSPQNFWKTTNLSIAPRLPMPRFSVHVSTGTDSSGPYVYIGNSPVAPQGNNYWTQVPMWITVTAVDDANNPLQGNVAVVSGSQVEGFEAGVVAGGYDSGPQPTGRKIYYMCLAARTPVRVSSERPPDLKPFSGNKEGCWVQVSISGHSDCVLQLVQGRPESSGKFGECPITMAAIIPPVLATPAALPAIINQPASAVVTIGQTARFAVTASGTAPLSYQWRRNGKDISGATSSSYVISHVTASDLGGQLAVVVSNVVGSVTSGTATITAPLSASVCPTVDGKSCQIPPVSTPFIPSGSGGVIGVGQVRPPNLSLTDIVTVTSGGTPVLGVTVTAEDEQASTAVTSASGVAVITHQACFRLPTTDADVRAKLPNRSVMSKSPLTCGAVVSKAGYVSVNIILP